MKLSSPTRLTRESLPDLPAGESFDLILQHINASNEEKTQALQQNLTIADNMNGAIVTHRLTHGVETSIQVPDGVKGRPVGVKAIKSEAINGGVRYRVADIDWRFIDSPDPKARQQMGITAFFAPPLGRVSVLRNATQAVATATQTPVQFDTVTDAAVGALSCDTATTTGTPAVNSKIVCAAAGFVLVTASALFNTDPGGGVREFWIQKNNTKGPAWGDSCGTVGYQGSSMAAQISVAAGDYLQLGVFQDSGGSVNLLGGANGARFQARYIDPPATAQNDVTFVVYGG